MKQSDIIAYSEALSAPARDTLQTMSDDTLVAIIGDLARECQAIAGELNPSMARAQWLHSAMCALCFLTPEYRRRELVNAARDN